LILFAFPSIAIVRYVKPTATGLGDGSSWANASADLQAMILASAVDDEVWVMAGVYKPQKDASGNTSPADSRDKLFYMKNGVRLYGGFVGTETMLSQRNWSDNKTILSGDIDNNDTNTDGNFISENHTDIVGNNVYHIMVFAGLGINSNTTLDGFILSGGKNTTTNPSTSQTINGFSIGSFRGAALMFSGAAGQIKNCVITGNLADAGVFYINNQNNYASLITTFENCYWIGNTSIGVGVIYMHRSYTNITNNVVANNSASNGGVIYISSNMPAGNPTNINHLTMYNNTTSSSSFGPVYLQAGTNTISNSAIRNAALSSPAILTNTSTLTISNSNILGSDVNGAWNAAMGTDGGNNIDAQPLFTNTANIVGADNKYFTADDGLTLTSCSPMLNLGNNGLTTDIMGNTRPFATTVDMGAFEFQSASTVPANPTGVMVSSTNITCGQSVTLSATCSGGATVTWYSVSVGGTSLGVGSLSVSPVNATNTYYASCESSATCVSAKRAATSVINVTLPDAPSNINSSVNNVCPSTVVSLSASCVNPLSPEWYNSGNSVIGTGNSINVSPTSTSTYTVKCKTGACLSTAGSITINVLGQPTNTTTSVSYVCAGQNVTFTASCLVGTVQWYDASNGGNFLGSGTSITITPNHNTSNFFRIFPQCSNGTCTSNRVFPSSYTFYPAPTGVSASQTSLCQGQGTSINLTATCVGASSVRWYSSATGSTLLGTTNPLAQTPTVTVIA
jgi:hypothetical protein